MIFKMCALLDTKVNVYHTPFAVISVGAAARMVVDLGKDLQTVVGRHPHDFTLVVLGEYDDQTGQLLPQVPQAIGTVAHFVGEHAELFPELPLRRNGSGSVESRKEV